MLGGSKYMKRLYLKYRTCRQKTTPNIGESTDDGLSILEIFLILKIPFLSEWIWLLWKHRYIVITSQYTTFRWDLLGFLCCVDWFLEPVFWFPKVVKRAVCGWRENPMHSACWYTRNRKMSVRVIVCRRPMVVLLFIATPRRQQMVTDDNIRHWLETKVQGYVVQ